MTGKRQSEQALDIANQSGVLRTGEAIAQGVHPEVLRRLCQQGKLNKIGRGLYRLPGARVTENATLAMVAKRFPNGVVCLLSALRFLGIGTQNPREVWLALRAGMAMPSSTGIPVRFTFFSGPTFDSGVEYHILDKVRVRVTCPAKTVADCFKYRNKVGLDVALEALSETLKQRKCTVDDIWRYAKLCRMANVMRPYLEAMS